MEFPGAVTAVERRLLAGLMAFVLATAWLESRSSVAAAARAGTPWLGFLALKAAPASVPLLFFAVYQPARRSFDVVYIPESTSLPDGRTLTQAHAAARREGAAEADAAKAMADAAQPLLGAAWPQAAPVAFYYDLIGERAEEEPPLLARRWLAGQTRGTRLWETMARRLMRPASGKGLEPFELYRLGQELHGAAAESPRAAWLPEPAERRAFFAGLAGEPRPPETRAMTVEVLNASGRKGVASDATKILRSKGADVMSTDNAAPQARTVVYDRTGRPENAAAALKMLACPSAEAVTQINAKRLVDVSVVIAEDCKSER